MKLFFAALTHIPLQVLKPRAKRSPFRSLDLQGISKYPHMSFNILTLKDESLLP